MSIGGTTQNNVPQVDPRKPTLVYDKTLGTNVMMKQHHVIKLDDMTEEQQRDMYSQLQTNNQNQDEDLYRLSLQFSQGSNFEMDQEGRPSDPMAGNAWMRNAGGMGGMEVLEDHHMGNESSHVSYQSQSREMMADGIDDQYLNADEQSSFDTNIRVTQSKDFFDNKIKMMPAMDDGSLPETPNNMVSGARNFMGEASFQTQEDRVSDPVKNRLQKLNREVNGRGSQMVNEMNMRESDDRFEEGGTESQSSIYKARRDF